ncbi:MAG: amidohydrolase [Pseudomonadota bacterium]
MTELQTGARRMRAMAVGFVLALAAGCQGVALDTAADAGSDAPTLILHNARVYSLAWSPPAPADGTPAADASLRNGQFVPDAEAVALRDGLIVAVGSDEAVLALSGPETEVIDLARATVLPGLVESHTHVFELGQKLNTIDLVDVATEAAAIACVAAVAADVEPGTWIQGQGWDEGAWANRFPSKAALSAAVPDHPVVLRSLHGFAVWVNQAALDRLAITARSTVPVGGEMPLGADGTPTGLFLNRATPMVLDALPELTDAELEANVLTALEQMIADGYTTVHEAGTPAAHMRVLEKLEREGRLPLRFYAMLSVRDEPLARQWLERGPDTDADSMLVTRSVKAYYDGSLGSRGARLLADYSDRPGHRGVSGSGYGFNQALTEQLMARGFQVGIHAIGDAGNRETLDFIERVQTQTGAGARHRIEHAQVLHPDDLPRLGALGVVASMEPPHAVEDKRWAEARLGAARIRGAYAWRSLRRTGAVLTFNADNPGSDHSIFYGLHSAVTRRDKSLQPTGGWYPQEAVTVEEALRAYTQGAAYAAFREQYTGSIEVGRWADLTVISIDPFEVAREVPDELLNGRILMTVIDGTVRYRANEADRVARR